MNATAEFKSGGLEIRLAGWTFANASTVLIGARGHRGGQRVAVMGMLAAPSDNEAIAFRAEVEPFTVEEVSFQFLKSVFAGQVSL